MPEQTTVQPPASEQDRTRRSLARTGAASALVAIGFTAVGVFYQGPKHDHDHSPWEFYAMAGLIVLTTALVFWYVLPRQLGKPDVGATALTLSSIAAILLLPAFWSGLPLVLGVGGAYLGHAGRNAAAGSKKSTAAVALGTLAALGYVAIYLLDTVDRAGIL